MNKLNKFSRVILAIAMMLCVALPTFAHDFEVNGIYYNYLDETAKTVSVTYGGSSYNSYSNEYTGAVSIPSSVTYNSTTYSVTSIGERAFSCCSGLTSITIPNSVTTIGSEAFRSCTGLTSVTIPNSVTTIDSYAFYRCTGLNSVNIPNSVTTISDKAFYYCYGLTSVTIPNSVTSIGFEAFRDCSGLTSVTIPNSVTSIGGSAFYNCTGLTSITIPNSVTSIGSCAFVDCTGLTSIVVEKGNTKYDSRDNCNAIIETATNTLMSGCKNTTIPNSVTSIGYSAFEYCNISVLHLPKSVTYVGEYNVGADVCYCYNPTPPSGGGRTSDRLFVPKGSLMAYATAEGWKDAEQILEFEVDDVVKPILTIAYPEGGVIKQTVDNGEILMLQIVPANGWKCNSVTFNGIDVTNQLDANGNYNTPSIIANSQLSIVFVKNDGSVANALVDNDIKVCVRGNVVTITGADEFSDVKIYNTAGTTIYTGIDKSITIDSNGIYILTVEGRTFKFAM